MLKIMKMKEYSACLFLGYLITHFSFVGYVALKEVYALSSA
jgi:hypothetical protein